MLLIEEAHVLAPQGQTPRYAQILVTAARTNANDLIMVTQRVQNLGTTMASQANVRVTFKVTDPNDLKRIATFFQNPAPAEFPNIGAYIAAVLPFQVLYTNEKNGLELPIHTSKTWDFAHFGESVPRRGDR